MKLGTVVFRGKSKKGKILLIRLPTGDDIPALRDYTNEISKEQTFITLQGEQFSLNEENKQMNPKFKKIIKNQAVMLVVFYGNKIIGIGDITMQERTSNHVGVLGLTIAKNFRNEGIGRLLMELVLREAKKNIKQLRIVTLGIFEGNSAALEMYKKFGFIVSGRMPEGIKYKNKFIDHIFMHKKIGS